MTTNVRAICGRFLAHELGAGPRPEKEIAEHARVYGVDISEAYAYTERLTREDGTAVLALDQDGMQSHRHMIAGWRGVPVIEDPQGLPTRKLNPSRMRPRPGGDPELPGTENYERLQRGERPVSRYQYRALLSVPIEAATDDEAVTRAAEYADSLTWRDSATIAGHLEYLIVATEPDRGRVVLEDPRFAAKHGLDTPGAFERRQGGRP